MIQADKKQTLSLDQIKKNYPAAIPSIETIRKGEDRYAIQIPGNGSAITHTRARAEGLLPN
ncbi:MAG: hypothetical protein FWG16_02835 [Micrococcales bacterium]|nr:hypothetical protein [Micrococcales bacterium]